MRWVERENKYLAFFGPSTKSFSNLVRKKMTSNASLGVQVGLVTQKLYRRLNSRGTTAVESELFARFSRTAAGHCLRGPASRPGSASVFDRAPESHED